MGRTRFSWRGLLALLGGVLALGGGASAPGPATPLLTVTPLTWHVIGLDSHAPATRAAPPSAPPRRYHITASAPGVGSVSTSTPRELYVEHLISQNRNSVISVTSSAIDSPGHATVIVGNTYTFTVTAKTATG